MKFDAYQSRAQLGTPNANISNIRVSDPGAMALAKAQGDFGTALVGGMMKISDKIDNAKALEANNEYNRLMSEGTAELMQNKEEMALDNFEKYDKLQKDVMQQVQKKYGGYIRYGAGAQAFNEFTMRDNNARRANMVRYQMGELEKYETTQFNNGLETCTNQSIAEGSTLESIDGGINRTLALVNNFYAPRYGSERAQLEARKAISALVGKNLLIQFNNGNSSGAEQILQRYGNSLDSNYRSQLAGTIAQTKRAAYVSNTAQQLFSENKTITYDEILERVKAGGNTGSLDNAFSEWEGKTGDNKGVACAEMVCKMGNTWGNPFLKEEAEKGVVWVPTMVADAKERGLLDTKNLIPQKGDVIVYGDNDHVVIADGNGGAVGNSTAEEKVKRYDDYKDIRGGDVTAIIRTGSLSGNTPLSDYDAKQQADKIYAEIQVFNNREKHQNTQYIHDATTAFTSYWLGKYEKGEAITEADARAFMNSYMTGNPEIDNALTLQALNISGGVKKGLGKAGKAGGSASNPFFETAFTSELSRFESETKAMDYLQKEFELGNISAKEYKKGFETTKKYFAGEGKFKYPWSHIKNAVLSDYQGDYANRESDYVLAQDEVYNKILKYKHDTNGSEPTQSWVIKEMKKAIAGIELDGIDTSMAQLYNKGIAGYEQRKNGDYFIELRDGRTVNVKKDVVEDTIKGDMPIEFYLGGGK